MLVFGDFQFEPDAHALFRAAQRVQLRPKAADLLALFLDRPGQVLSQNELAAGVWPDTTVEYEQQVRAAILEIRKALGDDPENPIFIETIPRRGYRFIAKVTKAKERSTNGHFLKAVLALLLMALGIGIFIDYRKQNLPTFLGKQFDLVLAVLPVRNEDRLPDFPTAGTTHALIAALAQQMPDNIGVIGRISADRYEASDLSAEEIARDLGADLILETSFR